MYTQLFTRVYLPQGSVLSEVSQPVAMQGGNAVQGDFVVFAIGGTSPNVAVAVQESNDLENWTDKGSATNIATIGYKLMTLQTGEGAAHVRLKVTLSGTSPTAIVSAGLNVAQL